MIFGKFFIVRAKENGLFVAEDLLTVPRERAFVGSRIKCEGKAAQKFGLEWWKFAEIIEVDQGEFASFLARRMALRAALSRRFYRHQSKRGRKPRFKRRLVVTEPTPDEQEAILAAYAPKEHRPRPKFWWHNEEYAVRSLSVELAYRWAKRVNSRLKLRDMKKWTQTKPEDLTIPDEDGVYRRKKRNKEWQKLL